MNYLSANTLGCIASGSGLESCLHFLSSVRRFICSSPPFHIAIFLPPHHFIRISSISCIMHYSLGLFLHPVLNSYSSHQRHQSLETQCMPNEVDPSVSYTPPQTPLITSSVPHINFNFTSPLYL